MTSSSSPSSNPCCGSGSVNHRLAASLLGSGGRPPLPSPTPPPAAASEAVAATSSRGFEDGDGSRRFCAGILAFCPWDLGSRIAARARGRCGSPPCRGAGVWEGGEVVWLDGEDAEEGEG